MKKIVLSLVLTLLGFEMPASANEFQEQAMCIATSADASFPKISVQVDPANHARAILILMASDGWTQVYSGPVQNTKASLSFSEDRRTVTATFDKSKFTAHMSFNNDNYLCDDRSFGD